jgi:hypothetical protein
VGECSDVSEESIASIFRVTALVDADGEVNPRNKMCLLYRMVQGIHFLPSLSLQHPVQPIQFT